MPEVIETTVFYLNELNDAAKDKAREWYRDGGFNYDWYHFIFEDFERICKIFGIHLATHAVGLMGGGTRQDPNIWFTGFWVQGDGASFEGSYSYTRGSCAAIRVYAPQDEALHRIGDSLAAIQKRNFYQLHAEIGKQGHYCHEYSMTITVSRESSTWQDMTVDAEDVLINALRDLARWLYRQLEREYEHQSSDEVVEETILANEYTFTSDGLRFG